MALATRVYADDHDDLIPQSNLDYQQLSDWNKLEHWALSMGLETDGRVG